MLIRCPWCGERDQSEFTHGGDAAARPADPDAMSLDDWLAGIYWRTNPEGPHAELWQHSAGCRAWFTALRDTVTHEVLATGPPQATLDAGPKGRAR